MARDMNFYLDPMERPFYDRGNDHRISAKPVDAAGLKVTLYEGNKNPSPQELASCGYETLSLAEQGGWDNKERQTTYQEAEDFDHTYIYTQGR